MTAPVTGLTLYDSDVNPSMLTSPPKDMVPRDESSRVSDACRPWTEVRSGSWPIVAVGLPLPPWFTRSSCWLLNEYVNEACVKRPEAEPLEAHRGQIEGQIVEVGDQVAIAAQQLVVALAVVLDRAHVGGDEAGVRIQNPVRPHGATHLVEPRVGKPIVHQHIGTESQKPRDGCVRIDAVPVRIAPARRPLSEPVRPRDGAV